MALATEVGRTATLPRLVDVQVEPTPRLNVWQPRRDTRETRSPLRIFFVNRYFHPDVSATGQILFDLARQLVARGVEVHVLCSRQLYDDPAAMLPKEEVIDGIHVHRAWTSRFGRDRLVGRGLDYMSFYVAAAARLASLVRRDDVVVAKTDPPLISIVAAAVVALRGACLINWLQDVFPEVASHLDANPLPGWLDHRIKQLRDYSLSVAHTNVVLGTRMRAYIEQRDIPRDRIRVIENWADSDVVPMPVSASQLRTRLGISDQFVVGYSGNLGRAHEFDTILAAAERLRSNEKVVFLMVGGGVKMQLLRRAVAEKGLTNFRFLPYQPRADLSDALAAADVHLTCLLPQLEGLIVPSKFYGILAAGRPVIFIGDAQGELARIIGTAECGAAVACGDAPALERALQTMQRDPQLRHQQGAAARQLFLDKYTVERATDRWVDVLNGVVSRTAA